MEKWFSGEELLISESNRGNYSPIINTGESENDEEDRKKGLGVTTVQENY